MVSENVKYLPIDEADAGDTTLVTPATGKRIRVINYLLVSAGTVAVSFKQGTTAVTGAMPLIANTGVSFPGDENGPAFQGARSAAIKLNLSAGIQVSGHLAYIEIE